jgi:hypothetical protein
VSLKDDAIELTVAAVVTLAVLWYVKKKVSDATGAIGDALSGAWNAASALPGEAVGAVGQAYTDSANQQADAYGTLAQGNSDLFGSGATVGTVSPWGSIGDKISSWWNGSSTSGSSSQDASSSTPVFPIDYGTGANDWSN